MSPLFAAMPPADLPTVAYVPSGLHTAELLAARSTADRHTVRSGDTVYGIAQRYNVSAESIVRANGLRDGGRWILPGSQLVIPGADGRTAVAPAPSKSTAASSSASSSTSSSGTRVTVRHGDTLSHLAVRHGTSVAALARANGLRDTRLIYPGQVLVVPGSGSAAKAAPAPDRARTSSSASRSSSGTAHGTVTVRSGDTLSGIAARHGVSVAALTSTNGISASAFIHPGQKLRLPGGSSAAPAKAKASKTLTRPYDADNIGDYKKGEKVDDTFLHYRYSDGVARSAAANREYLAGVDVPSRTAMKELIVQTSKRHGVDHKLMLALSYQESGWNMRAVSAANAIGAMQVIPASGDWASSLVGRELNLLDPQDNVEAGVVIMKTLLRMTTDDKDAIGGYYQGLGSVRQHGLFPDTRQYVRNIQHFAKTL